MRRSDHYTGPSFAEVKAQANGRWRDILPAFGVSLPPNGNHAPCPGCGGKDRFRFDDLDGDGTWICSQGGGDTAAGDGFALLGHARGWESALALREVAKAVNGTLAAESGTTKANGGNNLAATYIYKDADGNPKFGVERWEGADGSKTFRQFKRSNGKKVYSVKDVVKLPYRLETWAEQAHNHIWLCEGEKDADRLGELGLRTTTNAGGATTWPDELTPHFEGYDVKILEDNDAAGRKRSELLTRKLLSVATSVKVIRLPDLPDKGDVSDWLDGHTLDDLLAVAKATPQVEPEDVVEPPFLLSYDEMTKLPPADWLVEGGLPRHAKTLMFGPSNVFKSFLAVDLGCSVATGTNWHGHDVKQGKVVYIATEGANGIGRLRIKGWMNYHQIPEEDRRNIFLVNRELWITDTKDVEAFLAAVNERLGDIALFVVDVGAGTMEGSESDDETAKAWVAGLEAIIRELKCAGLCITHTGWADQTRARGHTHIWGSFDTRLQTRAIRTRAPASCASIDTRTRTASACGASGSTQPRSTTTTQRWSRCSMKVSIPAARTAKS
jgi:hypothetical protein